MVWKHSEVQEDESAVKKYTVYALHSSFDNEIRYVGQTSQSLEKRLDSHINHPKSRASMPVCAWVDDVKNRGGTIRAIVLEEDSVADLSEKFWIFEFRSKGARLLNRTIGGIGAQGMVHTEETRAKMSSASKGKKKSPEHVRKIRELAAARVGIKLSPETCKKLSDAKKGKSPKNLEALLAAKRESKIYRILISNPGF